ncbi:MAG: hypothetical protein ACKV2U_12070 [Bryobacteraceae bacterium]
MPNYKLLLTLNEPVFCSQAPTISNELVGLQYIPGPTLRGAFAAALVAAGRKSELAAWFADTGPRWSPAWPAAAEQTIVPTPASFLKDKSDVYGVHGTWNALIADPPHVSVTSESIRHQWIRVSNQWLQLGENSLPIAAHSVKMQSSMHVGLHYGRQAHRKEALFSREEIAPGQQFVAYLTSPSDNLPKEISLGKRRSAGNGGISVKISELTKDPWPLNSSTGETTIQLMSDAILPDCHGRYLRGLGDADWTKLLGVPATVESACSSNRTYIGWSGSSGLPREKVLTIAAGSVFRLKVDSAPVKALAEKGLGIRRHEGFGIIAVNPPWLANERYGTLKAVDAGKPPGPTPWPGFETTDTAVLKTLVQQAENVNVDKQKASALSHYAARVNTVAEITTHLQNLGNRPNPHGWKDANDSLTSELNKIHDLAKARFFLHILANKEAR